MGGRDYAEDPAVNNTVSDVVKVGDTGATMVTLDSRENRTCKYHRLHIAFLTCGKPALYLLTKACGARVPLCTKHANEILHRFDDSSPEKPRVDGSYGWPTSVTEEPLDLSTGNLYDRDTPVSIPDAIGDSTPVEMFAGGTSGGGGGGASFGGEPATESTVRQDSVTLSTPVESSSDASSSDSSSSDSSSSSDYSPSSSSDSSSSSSDYSSSSSDSSSSSSSSDYSSSSSDSSSSYSDSSSSSSDFSSSSPSSDSSS